jgi:hypothetical protein
MSNEELLNVILRAILYGSVAWVTMAIVLAIGGCITDWVKIRKR